MTKRQSWVAVACAVAFLASVAFAGEQSCCQKAIADGKKCEHPCCVEAAKAGNVCEKCNKNLMACCKEAVKAGKVCEKCNPKKEG